MSIYVKSSMPSSICCERAVHGACCHMISRLGRPSMAISTAGATASCLPTSTPHYVNRCAWLRGAMQPLRQPSSTFDKLRSQSVKTTEQGGDRGYDAGKKINGRKRHIVVDTIGLLLCVMVHSAGIQGRDGARLVLAAIKGRFGRLALVWADSAYAGQLVTWVHRHLRCVLEIVRRNPSSQGFEVLPRRWVVERTLGWLSRNRRLSRDYERLPVTSETFIYIAMTHLMLKRLRPIKMGAG